MQENEPESLTNDSISLTSMDDTSIKLTRVRETNNLYLHYARDGIWQRKCITVSSSSAEIGSCRLLSKPKRNYCVTRHEILAVPLWPTFLNTKPLNGSPILSAYLLTIQWPVSMANVIEMMLRPSPSNWLVRLLSIDGQVSLPVERDSSLIQDRLASRVNFVFPKSIEEDP